MSYKNLLLRSRRDTWLLRGIAAVISLLLWITVLGGKKMEITKKVVLDYQLPKELVIANQAPHEVTFRVTGPRALIREVEDRAKSIPIDLSAAKVGDYEVVIREEMLELPLGLKVVSVSQSSIPLRLDRMATKRVPMRPVFAGQLPVGLKVVSLTFKPSTVEIHGASQKVVGIDAVPTEPISLSANSLRQEFEVKLNLDDLSGVSVEEPFRVVHLVAELEGSLSRKWLKNVPITLRVRSGGSTRVVQDPGSLGIRLRPSVVNFLLEGADKVVSKLKSSDVEVWAEIPELKAGTVRSRLDWRLSPDVRVVKRTSDWVDVVVPPLQ
ncbi:MAG: hypothetical protein JST16_01405 [Bdellovibrionales bacterium]|nr:hypothetical protein [Bdellovibrionales bacterium]